MLTLLKKLKIPFIILTVIFCTNIIIFKLFRVSIFAPIKKATYFIVSINKAIDCKKHGGDYIYDGVFGYQCITEGGPTEEFPIAAKPVIYLYPEKPTNVTVKVNHTKGFAITYPDYENGWEVTAHPTGLLINKSDNREYSYLYWEGNPDADAVYDLSEGFVVKGQDTAKFLQEKLSSLGLTPKEYNEFIVYWYPKMVKNKFNLIHFATQDEYANKVSIDVTPHPETVARIFMVYKPISKHIVVKPQELESFERRGFTLVEWGGSELP